MFFHVVTLETVTPKFTIVMLHVRVVKFGGACLTHKDTKHSLNHEHIAWFVKVVKAMHAARRSDEMLVLVHGAGSFGHHEAQQFALQLGRDARVPQQPLGFAQTHSCVLKLHAHLLEQLCVSQVPALGISPLLHLSPPAASFFSHLEFAAGEMGLVPVLHGDVCLREKSDAKFGILSGDVIVEMVCKHYASRVRQVVFVTNVPGVYVQWPLACGAGKHHGLIHTVSLNRKDNSVQFRLFSGDHVMNSQFSHSTVVGSGDSGGGSSGGSSGDSGSSGSNGSGCADANNDGSSSAKNEVIIVNNENDVTGGIKQKIASCLSIVQNQWAKCVIIAESQSPSAWNILTSDSCDDDTICTRVISD